MQDCAVRYEPPASPADDLTGGGVAAALLLGDGRWAMEPAQQHGVAAGHGNGAAAKPAQPAVVLQSLSLWVAPADGEEHQNCASDHRDAISHAQQLCVHPSRKLSAEVSRPRI